MVQKTKTENFDFVRNHIRKIDQSFTNYDIQKALGLNYSQTKKILDSLVELEEIRFSESLKLYVKVRV